MRMTGKQPSENSNQGENQQSDDEAALTYGEQNEDWVASSLKQLYRSTVEEGIPDDMLALLDALDDEEDGEQEVSTTAGGSSASTGDSR